MNNADQLHVSIQQLQKRISMQDSLAQRKAYEDLEMLDVLLDLAKQLIEALLQLTRCELQEGEMYATANYLVAAEHYYKVIEFKRLSNVAVTTKGGIS